MRLLYDIFIRLFHFGILIAGLFSEKPKKWVSGRANWQVRLAKAISEIDNDSQAPTLWMHCASLGEFEQGRSVIEAYKVTHPKAVIILSFFSPSGYEIRKNYNLANHVCYLPLDTRQNAQQFLDIIQPDIVIFVKYEFWYHHLDAIQQRSIPLYLIAGAFRKSQPFFKWYGTLHRSMLGYFEHFFVQNNRSKALLNQIGFENVSKVGDTRVDRVLQLASNPLELNYIEAFKGDQKLFVIGSSWEADEAIIFEILNEALPHGWKVVIAPHNVDQSNIQRLSKLIKLPHINYSDFNGKNSESIKVLIIDNIGLLSSIYQYGDFGYIGGGFGAGIHNTLEPIAFKLPIVFGPKYQKFQEAIALVRNKGAISINSATDFKTAFMYYLSETSRLDAGNSAHSYLGNNQGATETIMNLIKVNS